MITTLALSPALDVTYEIDRLVDGGITRPERATAVAGGKALNMARAAHARGAEVRVIVALGGLNGQRVHERLRADGLTPTTVALAAETRTCFALVERAGGATSTDLYEPATPFAAPEWAAFADAVRTAPPSTWTVVSGSIPSGVPLADLAAVLADRRSRGDRIAIDVAGGALAALAANSDLVKINRAEAAELLGREPDDAAAACAALRERFGTDAVVTDGIRGGAAIIDGGLRQLAPPRAVGRFPAGSGDAFFGGLLAGLDGGATLDEALELARDTAERNAQVPGQGVLAE